MKNLARLTNRIQKEQAIKDYQFVKNQLNSIEMDLYCLDLRQSAKQIDKITRQLINWAKSNNVKVILPEGWK